MASTDTPPAVRAMPTDGGAADQRPFQFGMRWVLAGTVVVSLVCATFNWLGTTWGTLVIWSLLLVGGHVLGNMWGSRAARRLPEGHTALGRQSLDGVGPLPHAPTTRLGAKGRLGWIPLVMTAVCVLGGGALGLTVFLLAGPVEAGLAGLVLGTLSLAVIGGIFGFLASSFLSVLARAWNQAARHHVRQTRRPWA